MQIIKIKYFYMFLFSVSSLFANPWSKPQVIRDSGVQPYIAIDHDDCIHLIFRDRATCDSIGADIFYTSLEGKSWTYAINLSNSKKHSMKPRMNIDNDNVLHVFWEDVCKPFRVPCPPVIFYSCYTGKDWIGPENIYQSPDTIYSIDYGGPAIKSNKQCYLMWRNGIYAECVKVETGSILNIETLKNECMTPNIYIDKKDNVHVACIDAFVAEGTHGGGKSDIFYFNYSKSDSAWSESILVYYDKDRYSHYPQIITDDLGRIHIIWLQDEDCNMFPDDLYHSFSDDGIHWTEAEDISNHDRKCYRFSMALDSKNRIHVVWPQPADKSLKKSHIWYGFFDGEAWSKPYRIIQEGEEMGNSPVIVVDSNDNLHVVWVGRLEKGGDKKLLYSRCNVN